LRRVVSGKRLTFADGEDILSDWMAENAFVTWCVDPAPWVAEERLISEVSLPLNLDMNKEHPFREALSGIRNAAKESARELPIL